MSPHISTQSDKINEGYCAIGGVHIRRFNAEKSKGEGIPTPKKYSVSRPTVHRTIKRMEKQNNK